MSNIVANGYCFTGDLSTMVIFALLTLADNVLLNALPFTLGRGPPQVAGFWNLTTTALILSVFADFIGQQVLILLTYRSGPNVALNLNNLSITIASAYSLVSLFWRTDQLAWASAIASIFKTIGGGSHATAFLTISLICENNSGSLRAALIYITGAITILCQTLASSITPFLASQTPILPYTLSISCCVLAGIFKTVNSKVGPSTSDRERAEGLLAQTLLPPTTTSRNTTSKAELGLLELYSKIWHNKPSKTRIMLKSLGFILFLAAMAKVTRPLFTTYIQGRIGITPATASYLWLIRVVMSLVIFAMVLPLILIILPKSGLELPSTTNLYIAKLSLPLMAIGALLIGVARSKPVLVSGLVINTLGVGTDLSLLGLAADEFAEDIGSYFFMVIASIESVGTVVGIGLLYPLYQSCLNDDTLFGGAPYYICAGLYTVCGIIIWRFIPLVNP